MHQSPFLPSFFSKAQTFVGLLLRQPNDHKSVQTFFWMLLLFLCAYPCNRSYALTEVRCINHWGSHRNCGRICAPKIQAKLNPKAFEKCIKAAYEVATIEGLAETVTPSCPWERPVGRARPVVACLMPYFGRRVSFRILSAFSNL